MSKEFAMDFSEYALEASQRFLFDAKGYMVFPGVFSSEQVAAMRAQIEGDHQNQMTTVPGGASERILSHPIVKGALKAIIGPDFRLDGIFSTIRFQGQGDHQGPHQGGPIHNPHFHYHFTDGKIFSGLTRMVVELNDVEDGDGGTYFLAGSHKANLPVPEEFLIKRDRYDAPFEGYAAPAGSLVFFSENTCHAGPVWSNPDHPRIAIFFAFCNIGMRWHRNTNVPPQVIEGLGPEAQWYFRDQWEWDPRGVYEERNILLINEDGTMTVSP